MKSVKPGRGPSMLEGVVGIFMTGFGILWTVSAFHESVVFAMFGVLWTCGAIVVTVFNLKNATGKNRYSVYDITDSSEEPDPLNERFAKPQNSTHVNGGSCSRFCPYCGTPAAVEFEFCNNCGKKLP